MPNTPDAAVKAHLHCTYAIYPNRVVSQYCFKTSAIFQWALNILAIDTDPAYLVSFDFIKKVE